MTPTAMALSLLRAFLRRSILEGRGHVRDLEALIRKVRQAEAAEAFCEMERAGVKLPRVVDWDDIRF